MKASLNTQRIFRVYKSGIIANLHGKGIEATINDSYGSRHKAGGIGHQVVDSATQFFGLTHASEWRLANDILATLSVRTVRIGQQRTVLLRQEKARSNGIDTDALAKLLSTLGSHIGGKVGDASLRSGIATDTRQWTEC